MNRWLVTGLLVGCGFHGAAHGVDARVAGDGPLASDAVVDPDGPLVGIDATPDAPDAPAPITTFVFEAEAFSGTTVGTAANNGWAIENTTTGHSGTGYLHLVPHDGDTCVMATVGSCATASYGVFVTVPGTYYLHLRAYATGANNDSLFGGMDGVAAGTFTTVPTDSTWHWLAAPSFVLTAGAHAASVWQRESGVRLDMVVLSMTSGDPALP